MDTSVRNRAIAVSLFLACLLLPFPTLRESAAAPADSVVSGICEGSVLPFGIVVPSEGFAAGCSQAYVLKHGTGGGDRGRYGLIELPPCPMGPCTNHGGQEKLTCELLHGNFCCSGDQFIGQEVVTLGGSRTGPFIQALSQRFWSDVDHREGQCYAEYVGNGQRILRVIALTPMGPGSKVHRVAGFARFFMRDRPDKSSDDLIGEFIPTDADAE